MQNYIDPKQLAEHCEDYIIDLINETLRNQIEVINPNHDSDESEIVNQAFAYLITNLYQNEISK